MDGARLTGVRLLSAAAAVGLVHAGFTLSWAVGGQWLLPTVGAWAVGLAKDRPGTAGVVLSVVALVKIAGSLVPVLVETGRVGGRRRWRALEWVGAIVLVGYGLANVLVAWAVLGGLLSSADGYDRAAELGHAALWDPLFALWGLLLAAGLLTTRTGWPHGHAPGTGES